MIPVGPLFNHPQTYNPVSYCGKSVDESAKTRPPTFGTIPGKQVKIKSTEVGKFEGGKE